MIVLPPSSALLDEISSPHFNHRWNACIALDATVWSKGYAACTPEEQELWLERLVEYLELSRNAWRSAALARHADFPAVGDVAPRSGTEAQPSLQGVQQSFDVLATQAGGAGADSVRIDDQSVGGVAKSEVGETRDAMELAGGR
jgi:hypothetical protein